MARIKLKRGERPQALGPRIVLEVDADGYGVVIVSARKPRAGVGLTAKQALHDYIDTSLPEMRAAAAGKGDAERREAVRAIEPVKAAAARRDLAEFLAAHFDDVQVEAEVESDDEQGSPAVELVSLPLELTGAAEPLCWREMSGAQRVQCVEEYPDILLQPIAPRLLMGATQATLGNSRTRSGVAEPQTTPDE